MGWIPTISEFSGPTYRRIAGAIKADIGSGRLVRGQQLPTHRALARALGVDLTTITRAYGEAAPEGAVGCACREGLVRVRDDCKARRRHSPSRCH
jgi:DNA-binding transcriptional regulator YhcF (GntR family)